VPDKNHKHDDPGGASNLLRIRITSGTLPGGPAAGGDTTSQKAQHRGRQLSSGNSHAGCNTCGRRQGLPQPCQPGRSRHPRAGGTLTPAAASMIRTRVRSQRLTRDACPAPAGQRSTRSAWWIRFPAGGPARAAPHCSDRDTLAALETGSPTCDRRRYRHHSPCMPPMLSAGGRPPAGASSRDQSAPSSPARPARPALAREHERGHGMRPRRLVARPHATRSRIANAATRQHMPLAN